MKNFHSINFHEKFTYMQMNLSTKQKPLFKGAAELLLQSSMLIIFAFSDAAKRVMCNDVMIMVTYYTYHK